MTGRAVGWVVVFGCVMTSASLQAHHSTAGIWAERTNCEVYEEGNETRQVRH